MTEPVLVTGAAGKTGLAVTRALAARGLEVRALIRREGQIEELERAGAVEILVADLADPGAMERSFEGASAVYYICPNLRPNETQLGRLAIDTAVAAGVDRFVYHSVLHPQVEKMPHHWQKLRVEEALFESGLAWTILQPTAYMENLFAGWEEIVGQGRLRIPYPSATRISLVALDDVGASAARVLDEAGHERAIYELVGSTPHSQDEVAEALGRGLGRSVSTSEVPAAETRATLEERGLGRYEVNALMRMFDYYGSHGLAGGSAVLSWLLDREPTTLAEFVQRRIRDEPS